MQDRIDTLHRDQSARVKTPKRSIRRQCRKKERTGFKKKRKNSFDQEGFTETRFRAVNY